MTGAAVLAVTVLLLGQDWTVPDAERAVENPVEATPEAVAAGAASYEKQCMMCHGEQFEGDGPAAAMFPKAPPDLSTKEARERMTDGEIFYKITMGKSPMPPMEAKLSEEERWQLVHFLRTLQAE